MKRTQKPQTDPRPPIARGETEFHVLFNADGGPVQECLIEASCLLECEAVLQQRHPEAVYWEIGF
jgi:hypothetical protein